MIREHRKNGLGTHWASRTNLFRPKTDIAMPKNAIPKTTVTQPDDQGTPKNESVTHWASQTNLFRPKT